MAYMTRRRTLSKRLDSTNYGDKIDDGLGEGGRLQELGNQFEAEKGGLEERLERIRAIELPEERKAPLIAEVQSMIAALQAQYDRDVAEAQENLETELDEVISQMENVAEDIDEQAADLQQMRMEAATDVDTGSAEQKLAQEAQVLRDQQNTAKQRMGEMHQLVADQKSRIHSRPN